MSKHSKRRKKVRLNSNVWLWVCLALGAVCLGILGLQKIWGTNSAVSGEDWRPQVGSPPYRVAIDAGHGGDDPGAQGVVQESQMTAATAAALTALLEKDPHYIPLNTRESYTTTAKPAERAEYTNQQSPQLLLSIHGALTALLEKDPHYIPLNTRESYTTTAKPAERAEYTNQQSPQLLLSIHGNSAPAGVEASGFECYPAVPGRTWHQESLYFAQLLAEQMQGAGAVLRGQGGVRYIYYQGQTKHMVEASCTDVRSELSFTILEAADCPAVLAEQCFVTSAEDVARFGDESGCRRAARTDVRSELSFTILEAADCPAVLAEQCFVTSAEDVARFGDESGCRRAARIYYETICEYFGTQPMPE